MSIVKAYKRNGRSENEKYKRFNEVSVYKLLLGTRATEKK